MTESSKKVRTALGALLFALILGSAQACAESPTAPEGDGEPICYWFNGTLHCVQE